MRDISKIIIKMLEIVVDKEMRRQLNYLLTQYAYFPPELMYELWGELHYICSSYLTNPTEDIHFKLIEIFSGMSTNATAENVVGDEIKIFSDTEVGNVKSVNDAKIVKVGNNEMFAEFDKYSVKLLWNDRWIVEGIAPKENQLRFP